jgi:uncharacterized membrane protein YgdD (TMEM256/DUF423 family)
MNWKSAIGWAGALLGFSGVLLGALGAHALEEVLSAKSLESYKTGVFYLQWHGSLLLILGLIFRNESRLPVQIQWASLFWGIGIFFFSGSILGLVLLPLLGINSHFLGPITPIGGFSLMLGWFYLFLFFIKHFKYKQPHAE